MPRYFVAKFKSNGWRFLEDYDKNGVGAKLIDYFIRFTHEVQLSKATGSHGPHTLKLSQMHCICSTIKTFENIQNWGSINLTSIECAMLRMNHVKRRRKILILTTILNGFIFTFLLFQTDSNIRSLLRLQCAHFTIPSVEVLFILRAALYGPIIFWWIIIHTSKPLTFFPLLAPIPSFRLHAFLRHILHHKIVFIFGCKMWIWAVCGIWTSIVF